tara:strand:- start:264 stop:452 length:189 start_codon:yes stop_codon:yes gene_type:complete
LFGEGHVNQISFGEDEFGSFSLRSIGITGFSGVTCRGWLGIRRISDFDLFAGLFHSPEQGFW